MAYFSFFAADADEATPGKTTAVHFLKLQSLCWQYYSTVVSAYKKIVPQKIS
jgi:hypothetical protein